VGEEENVIEASVSLSQEGDSTEHAEAWRRIHSAHGILVPGGFGSRGVEGKILAAQYARQHNVPYLGICLGMQVSGPLLLECRLMSIRPFCPHVLPYSPVSPLHYKPIQNFPMRDI
jgi:hypothetical protein